MKILISTSTFGETDNSPIRLLQNEGFAVQLNPHKRRLTPDESIRLLVGVDGLIAGVEDLSRKVLEKTRLRAICRCGTGMDNVDTDAANDLGIKVSNTPNAPVQSVAELVVGGMISCMRNTCQMNDALHQGEWKKIVGYQLRGKNLLLVGYGRIGRAVEDLLTPFGVKFFISDPTIDETNSVWKNLNLMDIISLHANTKDCLLDKEAFNNMKDGVFICNSARGSLIDEEALILSLESGKVAGAWIDVFREEPYSGKLQSFPNVVLTPHVGSYTRECRVDMETQSAVSIMNMLRE